MDTALRKQLLTKVSDILTRAGYKLEKYSVDDKNQSRYFHLLAIKEGQKYFIKANIYSRLFQDALNESISGLLPEGNNFEFIKPIDQFKLDDDRLIYVFPFIDLPTISSEVSDFNDLNLPKSDLQLFFKCLYNALDALDKSRLYTFKDVYGKYILNAEQINSWLTQIDPGDLYAVKALQVLGQSLSAFKEYSPSISDIQLQNMFWDTKNSRLLLFDMEHVVNMPRHYDVANFAAGTYSIYGQEELAVHWLRHYLKTLPHSIDQLRQLQLLLLWTGINWYIYFMKLSDKRRTERAVSFLKWSLFEFTVMINELK